MITKYAFNSSFYNNPWTDPTWRNLYLNSGANWLRMGAFYGENNNPHNFCKWFDSQNIKVLAVFAWRLCTDLELTDLSEWTTSVRNAIPIYGPYIDAIECWNEPDLAPHRRTGYLDVSGLSPASTRHNTLVTNYMNLLRVLREELDDSDYSYLPILAGSIATPRNSSADPEWWTGDYYGGTFLQAIVDAGSHDYAYGYSWHCYDWFLTGANGISSITDCYNRVRGIVDSGTNGENYPIWQTEAGHSASNETVQRDMITGWVNEMSAVNIPFFSTYNWYTTSLNIIKPGLIPTKVYYALQSLGNGNFFKDTFTGGSHDFDGTSEPIGTLSFDQTNPWLPNGYNAQIDLTGGISNGTCCLYKDISDETVDVIYSKIENVKFTLHPDVSDELRIISFSESAAASAIAYYGFIQQSGVMRPFVYYRDNSVWYTSIDTGTSVVAGQNYTLEAAIYRHASAGWIRLWVDGTLVVEETGLTNTDRALNYFNVGFIYSDTGAAMGISFSLPTLSTERIWPEWNGEWQGVVHPAKVGILRAQNISQIW